MDNAPWLTILGWGEDGPDGLTATSAKILQDAEIIAGATRHLDLLPPDYNATRFCWPVPFAAGLAPFLALRGKKVVLLASGHPFWFGAGTSITQHLQPEEWRALPGLSSFSLAAAALGWPLETTHCMGLHAAPLERLRPHLGVNKRLLITLKPNVNPEAVLAELYKQTPLEETFGINNVVLVNGIPETLGIYDLCKHYVDHRLNVVNRRTQFRLDRAQDRLAARRLLGVHLLCAPTRLRVRSPSLSLAPSPRRGLPGRASEQGATPPAK